MSNISNDNQYNQTKKLRSGSYKQGTAKQRNGRGDNNNTSKSNSIPLVGSGMIGSTTSHPNILVTVRCRPLSQREFDLSQVETVKILNGNGVCVMNSMETRGQKPQTKEQQFFFDFVFDKNTKQKEVYENSTKFLLSGIVEGFNATIFAYGTTGSGKTYTMLGTDKDAGIMPRAVIDLFKLIEKAKTKEFKGKMSYLEIYNENVHDLLGNPEENGEGREDPGKGIIINGGKEFEITNTTTCFDLLLKGNSKRAVESTNSNATSSRSHAILQLYLENREKTETKIVCGKFIMVDLAGSEKSGNHAAGGAAMRQVEGSNINKSLLAGGNCINAGVDNKSDTRAFIPWRDSKGTRGLKDSLGGNSRMVMISTISPSLFNIEETINTGGYANRAKNIQTTVKKNTVDVDYHISKYDEVISSLTNELESGRHQLAVKTHNKHLLKPQENKSVTQSSKIEKLSKEITAHFQEEIRSKDELIDNEKMIETLSSTIKEKEFQGFKLINTKGTNTSMMKEKEYRTQITKLTEQLNIQKGLVLSKEAKYNELYNRREKYENGIAKYNKDKNGTALQYGFQSFVGEINNMSNEHARRQNLNALRQKDIKISNGIEQLKIRDEYITSEKKELARKKVKFNFEYEDNIKKVEDLGIDRSFHLPMVIQQEIPVPKTASPKRIHSTSGDGSNQGNQQSHQQMISNKYDYSQYNNPNIVKEKQVIKTKTNEIINKSKKNELTQLKLNIGNDGYKSSKIMYVNKKSQSNRGYDDDNNIITFDARILNKSQSNVSIHSNDVSNSDGSISGIKNPKEREIDHKLKKLMGMTKKISPYINK